MLTHMHAHMRTEMAKGLFKSGLFTDAKQCYSLAGDQKGTERCKVSEFAYVASLPEGSDLLPFLKQADGK